ENKIEEEILPLVKPSITEEQLALHIATENLVIQFSFDLKVVPEEKLVEEKPKVEEETKVEEKIESTSNERDQEIDATFKEIEELKTDQANETPGISNENNNQENQEHEKEEEKGRETEEQNKQEDAEPKEEKSKEL